ncbi:MAG: hypothetical protein JRJ41_02670 [Deltaproteobacteria bacterium]|nr:hypothetical protein [Deltaproteobacteria bacterium]
MNERVPSSKEINNLIEDISAKTRKKENTEQNKEKLSRSDKAILMLAKEYPGANNHQLGLKLREFGAVKNERTIYKRLKKSDYLRGEIESIRKNNHEFLSREIVPEALKIHKRVLKDRSISDLKKKDWVQMAEKAEWRLDQPPVQLKTININVIDQIQAMIRNDVK